MLGAKNGLNLLKLGAKNESNLLKLGAKNGMKVLGYVFSKEITGKLFLLSIFFVLLHHQFK